MSGIEDRLQKIEQRLTALELALGVGAPPASSSPPPAATPEPDAATAASEPAPTVLPPSARLAPPVAPLELPTVPEPTLRDFERTVGGRWYAVAGAIVVIIGVGLFIQLAVQQGWVRAIPAELKCLATGAFGALLLGGAEFLRRRINAWAAFGLNAAGLGSIYIAVAGAYQRYEIITSAPAFILLVAVTLLGIFIGMRARIVGVSIVALVGGYMAPFLVSSEVTDPRILPAFWLMLQATGLALSAIRGGLFASARWLTWGLTVLLGGVWVLAEGTDSPLLAAVLLALAWGLVHAELLWSARREARPRAYSTWLGVWCSFVTSAWAAFLGWVIARALSDIPDWFPPAAGAVAAGILAIILAGSLRLLRDVPRTQAERLGAGLLTQAGAMGLIAVAVALRGPAEVGAWISLGIAGVIAGRWIGAPSLWAYGLVNLVVGALRLVLYDSWTGMHTPMHRFLGLDLSTWTLFMAIACAGWLAAAILLAWERTLEDEDPRPPIDDRLARGIIAKPVSGVACLLALLSVLSIDADDRSLTISWMALALGAGFLPWHRLRTTWHACWMSILALGLWAANFAHFDAWRPGAFAPLLHPALWIALAGGIVCLVAFRRAVAAEKHVPEFAAATLRAFGGAALLLMVFLATTFEAIRIVEGAFTDATAQRAAVSIWWGLFAIGLLVLGFVRDRTPVRIAGLALLGIATLKAVLLDLAGVSLGARTLSVFGLGILMMGVGIAYAMGSRALKARGQP